MKIITANVNGIRAAAKKGFLDWLSGCDADIVCLQEVENRRVLDDLATLLRQDDGPGYAHIVHREGPDHRGVDVAMLFGERVEGVELCDEFGELVGGHLEFGRDRRAARASARAPARPRRAPRPSPGGDRRPRPRGTG